MQRSRFTATRSVSLLRPLWSPRPAIPATAVPAPRLFTSNHPLLLLTRNSTPRPQLPFLAQSGAQIPRSLVQRHVARVLSTENKRYVKQQTVLAAKWTGLGFVVIGLLAFATYSWRCELIERVNPSPPEWSYLTRSAWRTAWLSYSDDVSQMARVDWGRVGEYWRLCLLRLEDQEKDGKGVVSISPQGASAHEAVRGVGPAGLDVSSKSEAWKAGYAEAVMRTALAAEHLQGMVYDRRQDAFFPKSTVIGPSNPSPRRLPPQSTPPREEDCEDAFPNPAVLYNRIAHGVGFTPKQRIDALHAHANWLEFNKDTLGAEEQYQYAIAVARSSLPSHSIPTNSTEIAVNRPSNADINAHPESATSNLVNSLTAQATYLSRTSRLSEALPILLSNLHTVRYAISHPSQPSTSGTITQPKPPGPLAGWSAKLFRPDEFPLPLSTGNEPLSSVAPAALKCREAELMAYIGEILFSTSTSRQDDGLSWTRSAAESAAVTLREIAETSRTVQGDGAQKERERERKTGMEKAERERCRECLVMGLVNWEVMAGRLAERGEQRQESTGWKGWFGGSRTMREVDGGLQRAEMLKSGLIRDGLVEPWAFVGK